MTSLKCKYLIIGMSGTGKSTIVDEYCKRHNKISLLSYTTRKIRKNENEHPTHIHVSQKAADRIMKTREIIGYSKYANHIYFATKQQFKNSDFYIIDQNGIDCLQQLNIDIPYKIIFFYANEFERVSRMQTRQDEVVNIQERIKKDSVLFDHNKLLAISDYQLCCNGSKESVMLQFSNIIENSERSFKKNG